MCNMKYKYQLGKIGGKISIVKRDSSKIKSNKNTESKNTYCTMYIVRHGVTDWNEQRKLQGSTDIPLNDRGREQAKVFADTLKDIHFDAAYSSDLSRAAETAQIILADREIEVKLSKALREHNHGRTEGTTQQERETVKELREPLEKFFALSPQKQWHVKTFPDQESRHESSTRFINEFRAIAAAHLNHTVLVGSHSGIMRQLLIVLGEMEHEDFYKWRFEHTGYIKLHSDGVDFFVDDVVELVPWIK